MIDPDDYLDIKDGSRLYALPKKKDFFIKKLTLLFGASGTGKSTLMDEILILCKDDIPVVFAIAPTNQSNGMFDDKIPPRCIKDGKDPHVTVKFLEDFLQRQKDVSELYKLSNNADILKPMFDMISNERDRLLETKIIRQAVNGTDTITKDNQLNIAQKKQRRRQISDVRDKTLIKLYKTVIRGNKQRLKPMVDDDKFKKVALECLDINPNCMLILDDCAAFFKVWYKLSTAVKDLFYAGRQYFITTIITSQDDKEIDSELRKNSMISIFTTPQIATANFERKSNHYPKFVVNKSKLCISEVFKQMDGEETHFRKLIYINNLADPFRYTIADLYPDFKMGADSTWEISEKLQAGKKVSVETNPFFERYAKR